MPKFNSDFVAYSEKIQGTKNDGIDTQNYTKPWAIKHHMDIVWNKNTFKYKKLLTWMKRNSVNLFFKQRSKINIFKI